MKKAWILIPVFEDWESLSALLPAIHGLETDWQFDVLLVNDHPLSAPPDWQPPLTAGGRVASVRILQLRRNVGHQRAIALGLCHWRKQGYAGPVVVMDADGEDQPADILRLLDAAEQKAWRPVMFAARQKRSEKPVFRAGYQAYRFVHALLTGVQVRFGNFSVLCAPHIDSLIHQSDLWNHYANAVMRSRLPYESIPTDRGVRLAGQSRLNLAGWVAHGLSALAMYSDMAGTRVLLVSLAGLLASTVFVIGVAVQGFFAPIGPALRFLMVSLMLFLIFLQVATATTLFLFMVLGNRSASSFIPVRDGEILVGGEEMRWTASRDT